MRSWKKPTPKQVDRAVALLARAEQYRYFFDRLENPEWLEPLWKKGFFKHPPAPIRYEEKGTLRFPPWPEAKYLARMAKHKPELVARIIQEMDDTENASVLSDLVDALLAMPPDISAQLVERVARWAESPYWLLPEKLGQLLAHLAKGGRTDEALSMSRVLLDLLPDEHRISPGLDDADHIPPEPRARFDIWDYEQILKEHYPDLIRQAGLPALELLCDLLEKAIQLSLTHSESEGPEDFSSIWRPAIEDHPQNLGDTIKDALVSAVRDAAELVVRSNKATVEEVVNTLEGRRWKVFRRVALHILRVFPDQSEALTAKRLTDRSLFDDVGLQHEYMLLLREQFSQLKSEEQVKILGWIKDGPRMDRRKQRIESEAGKSPSEEEVIRYREIWQRDQLAWVGPENLPPEWQKRYQELVGKYGEPDNKGFPVYTSTAWFGRTSPKTPDELQKMAVENIVNYLKEWTPSPNIFGESFKEGLGRALSEAVTQEPRRFALVAENFKDLDPTYIRHLISGLHDSLKKEKTFPWSSVLSLCNSVLSQPREIPGHRSKSRDADPDWSWTRLEIGKLLFAGLREGPGVIPFKFRRKVWHIIKSLTEDSNPTPEYEKKFAGSSRAPADLSINTVRGQAIHTVIQYAYWVRRNLKKLNSTMDSAHIGFEKMPEVREVLEKHLDIQKDPSVAIRAVYGWWFPFLEDLDAKWVQEHSDRIFPLSTEKQSYFDAAWSAYVTMNHPYANVFDLLRRQYHYAVLRIGSKQNISKLPPATERASVQHLMAFYWLGKLTPEDPIWRDFWEKAPEEIRKHALEFIGRSLVQTEEEIPPRILERLKNLWEARLETAKALPDQLHEELEAFGWWFVSQKFDIYWAISQLVKTLQFVHKVEPVHQVIETLTQTVHTHPRESIKCLKSMIEGYLGRSKPWALHANIPNIRRILEIGLRESASNPLACQVIQYLGSLGFIGEFRDLLRG